MKIIFNNIFHSLTSLSSLRPFEFSSCLMTSIDEGTVEPWKMGEGTRYLNEVEDESSRPNFSWNWSLYEAIQYFQNICQAGLESCWSSNKCTYFHGFFWFIAAKWMPCWSKSKLCGDSNFLTDLIFLKRRCSFHI